MEIIENMNLDQAEYFNQKKWVSPLNFGKELANIKFPKNVYIHDVTLRDGEQTCGLNWTEEERIKIACELSDFGVKRIEVGMPVISEDIRNSIRKLIDMDLDADIVPFARAKREDIDLSAQVGAKHIVVEHAVNPYLCKYAYDVDTNELLSRVIDSIKYAKSKGFHTTFMGWDVTRATFDYVKKVYKKVVEEAKPDALVYTDSFGVASPLAVYNVIKELKDMFDIPIEFHVHNEFGMAMGSVIAAVQAGVDGIHSSINGLGERTGNVPTEEVAAALDILLNIDTGIKINKINHITSLIEEITGLEIPYNKPITGKKLFWVESGVAVHAKEKMEKNGIKPAMTPYLPEIVGRDDIKVVLGGSSGKASVKYYLDKLGLDYKEDELELIVDKVKKKGRQKRNVLTEEEFKELVEKVKE